MIALLLLGFEFVRGAKVEVQPEDQAIAAVTPHDLAMTQILGLHSQLKSLDGDKMKNMADAILMLTKQNATPGLAQFSTIIGNTIENDMKPKIKSNFASMQVSLNKTYTFGYQLCDTSLDVGLGVNGTTTQMRQIFKSLSATHTACRNKESSSEAALSSCANTLNSMAKLQNVTCNDLKSLDQSGPSPCSKHNPESYTDYTNRMVQYFQSEKDKLSSTKSGCDLATAQVKSQTSACKSVKDNYTANKSSCDSFQDQMNAASCSVLLASQNFTSELHILLCSTYCELQGHLGSHRC